MLPSHACLFCYIKINPITCSSLTSTVLGLRLCRIKKVLPHDKSCFCYNQHDKHVYSDNQLYL